MPIKGFSKFMSDNESDDNNSSSSSTQGASESNILASQSEKDAKRVAFLEESLSRIDKLKIYQGFFKNPLIEELINSLIVVHKMFEKNERIRINKLDQFHYYYTDNFLNFLARLKESMVEKMEIVKSSIEVIDEKIANLNNNVNFEKKYANDKKIYAANVKMFFSNLFKILCDRLDVDIYKYNGLTLKQEDMFFHLKNGTTNYIQINKEVFDKFLNKNIKTYPRYGGIEVENKVLGKLNKVSFYCDYIDGFVATDCIYEIFKMRNTSDYFVFDISNMRLQMIDFSDIYKLIEANSQKKGNTKNSLVEEKNRLLSKLGSMSNISDPNFTTTIQDFISKATAETFLDNDDEVNLENQHMQNMLKTQRFDV